MLFVVSTNKCASVNPIEMVECFAIERHHAFSIRTSNFEKDIIHVRIVQVLYTFINLKAFAEILFDLRP